MTRPLTSTPRRDYPWPTPLPDRPARPAAPAQPVLRRHPDARRLAAAHRDVGDHRRRARRDQHRRRLAEGQEPRPRPPGRGQRRRPRRGLPLLRGARPRDRRRPPRADAESIDEISQKYLGMPYPNFTGIAGDAGARHHRGRQGHAARAGLTAVSAGQPWPIRSSSATLVSFTRGRPCGSPADRSWSSISFQWSSVTSLGCRDSSHSTSVLGVVVAEVGERPRREIGEQRVDGVLRVLLVAADHAGRPALDPADDVLVAAALDPAVGVRDGAGPVVERQPGRGHARGSRRRAPPAARAVPRARRCPWRRRGRRRRPARCGRARSTRPGRRP